MSLSLPCLSHNPVQFLMAFLIIWQNTVYLFVYFVPPSSKIRMPWHLTPVSFKKTRGNKWWQGCGEKGTLVHCWWECKLVQPLWKTIWRFLKKLKIESLCDPAILLLGIYPKEMKWISQKSYLYSHVYCSISQDMETILRVHWWMNE